MFCNQCGNKLPEGALFCNKCGAKQEPMVQQPVETPVEAAPVEEVKPVEVQAPVEQPVPVTPIAETPVPAEPTPEVPTPVTPTPVAPNTPVQKKAEKKKVPFFVWVLLVIMVIALVVVGLIFILGGKNKKPSSYAKFNEKSVILVDDVAVTLSGTNCNLDRIYSQSTNKDSTVHAFTNSDRELFVINDKLDPVSVAQEVTTFNISFTGDYVYYLLNDEDDYDHQTLYLYDVKKDNSVKIDTDVFPDYVVLSPSGKYVSYLKDFEGYSDNTLYLAGIGKDSVKLDKDGSYPVAVSDNGKNVFFLNSSDGESVKFYCYNGKENLKVAKNVSDTFHFNETISEVVFVRNGDTYFYTPNMEEPVKICSKSIKRFYNGSEESMEVYHNYYGRIYSKKSLKDSLFVASGQLFWLNKNATDSVKICDTDVVCRVSADGKSVLAMKRGAIYKFSNFGPNMSPKFICEPPVDVEYVIASDDLSTIYVVSDEDELYFVKGSNKVERISNDFTYKSYKIAYNEAEKKIYYIEDGDLYSAGKNAKSKVLVMEDVEELQSFGDGVVFGDEDEKMYYVEKKNPVVIYDADNSEDEDED